MKFHTINATLWLISMQKLKTKKKLISFKQWLTMQCVQPPNCMAVINGEILI